MPLYDMKNCSFSTNNARLINVGFPNLPPVDKNEINATCCAYPILRPNV